SHSAIFSSTFMLELYKGFTEFARLVYPLVHRKSQPSKSICWSAGHAFREASSIRLYSMDCLSQFRTVTPGVRLWDAAKGHVCLGAVRGLGSAHAVGVAALRLPQPPSATSTRALRLQRADGRRGRPHRPLSGRLGRRPRRGGVPERELGT